MTEEELPGFIVTRKMLLICGAVLAFAMVLLIAAGVAGWLALKGIEDDRARQNAKVDARQNRTDDELRRLLNPTPEEYREQLQRGIKRCLAEPSCRRLFPGLEAGPGAKSGQSLPSPTAPRSTSPGVPPGPGSPPASGRGDIPPDSAPAPNPPGSVRPPRPGGGRPPAQPAPSPPRPMIDLQAPLPLHGCVDGVLGINC